VNKIKTTNKTTNLFIIITFLILIIFVLGAEVIEGAEEVAGTIAHDVSEEDIEAITESDGAVYVDEDGYIKEVHVVSEGNTVAIFTTVKGKVEEPKESAPSEPSTTTTSDKEKKDKDEPTTQPPPCFLAGTLIALSDGTEKPIEDVEVGDIVLSYDKKTQTNVFSIVEKTSYHPKEQSNGYLIINNRLRVTPNHPVLVNGRWQKIGNANIGNVLRLQDGNNLIITSIRRVYDKVPTYNLNIKDTQTYYAGDVLVHNGCGTTKDIPDTTTTTTTTTTDTTTTTTTTTTDTTTTDPCEGVTCPSGGWSCSTYSCCSPTPDVKCTCESCNYIDYYCVDGSCKSQITDTSFDRYNCHPCGYCKTCKNGACIDKPGVKGTVTNVSLEKIKGAEIKILGLDKSYTTDENGYYFICEFPQGTYDIVASKKGFDPVNEQFDFDGTSIVNINFVLYTAGSECKPDCSKTTDEKPRCHADCDGINGCRFYDQRTKELCTVPYSRVVNVLESYNSTHKLLCCDGEPYLYPKISGDQLVFPESEHHVKITRIVFFRGKFARMIIDLFV